MRRSFSAGSKLISKSAAPLIQIKDRVAEMRILRTEQRPTGRVEEPRFPKSGSILYPNGTKQVPLNGIASNLPRVEIDKRDGRMDVYQILMQDHRTVEQLFIKIEQTDDLERREQMFGKLRLALEDHTLVAENLFYPEIDKLKIWSLRRSMNT
jgi:hypothetical protein